MATLKEVADLAGVAPMTVSRVINNPDLVKLNLLPGNSLIENYKTMQSHVNIWRGFANSLLVAIPYTIIAGYFGAFTAYGFAKYQFPGKKVLYAVVLASMMIPSQVTIIGFYQLNLRLKMLNSYIKLFASPWSPPTWMKYPPVYNWGKLIWTEENLRAYANYLVKFITTYEAEGTVEFEFENEQYRFELEPKSVNSIILK